MSDNAKSVAIRVVRTFFMAFIPYLIAEVVTGGSVRVLADFALWDGASVAGLAALGSLIWNTGEVIKGVNYNRG